MPDFIFNIIKIPLRAVSNWALRRHGIEVKQYCIQENFGGWVVYRKGDSIKEFFLESSAYVFAFELVEHD